MSPFKLKLLSSTQSPVILFQGGYAVQAKNVPLSQLFSSTLLLCGLVY